MACLGSLEQATQSVLQHVTDREHKVGLRSVISHIMNTSGAVLSAGGHSHADSAV